MAVLHLEIDDRDISDELSRGEFVVDVSKDTRQMNLINEEKKRKDLSPIDQTKTHSCNDLRCLHRIPFPFDECLVFRVRSDQQ